MAIDTSTAEPRSRRAILAGAVGGLAGLIGSRFASPDRTTAAAGGPVIMGAANTAGTTNTSLTTASSGTAMLVTQNGTGTALRGSAVGVGSIAGFFTATNGTGVSGVTGSGGTYGVFAQNTGAAGTAGALRASGGNNHGLVATSAGATVNAVRAVNTNTGDAVALYAQADGTGVAIHGVGTNSQGVRGNGLQGVVGIGVQMGISGSGAIGVFGDGGVNGTGGRFESSGAAGVGVVAESIDGTAMSASGATTGIHASAPTALGNHAGLFDGDVQVNGTLSKTAGSFKIDHPLDPANKYLAHSFVESPDMLNVYSGTAKLDATGQATVILPAWFDALNRDVRYQLTAIGTGAPELHVAQKVKANAFRIAGGDAGQEVCWQLTGVRQDVYAKERPIVVEQAKAPADRGKYIYPQGHGKGEAAQIGRLATPKSPKASAPRR